jgi:hypothetical protein
MKQCETIVQNKRARNIVREYNKFLRETKINIEEMKRVTMISLKQLLKLADGDIIEIYEDNTLSVIANKEVKNA